MSIIDRVTLYVLCFTAAVIIYYLRFYIAYLYYVIKLKIITRKNKRKVI